MKRRGDDVYPWENMQRLIDAHNLVIKPWAERSGVVPSTVYNWHKAGVVSGQGTTYEKLARGAGMHIDEFLAVLSGKKRLPQVALRVLEREDILQLRGQKTVSATAFSQRTLLPGVYTGVDSDTLALVRIDDTSFNRRCPVGGFAIIDWSDREPVPGRPYLITHDGRQMVRRFRAAPPSWAADSYDEYPTITAAGVEVIARVRSFHTPES